MRFRNLAITALAMSALYQTAVARAEENRQLGPHVHGHGTLSIAIEANNAAMELRVPGMDIVGFEHEVNGPDEKTLVEAARKDLQENALQLFVLPKSADCKITSSRVEVVAEEDPEGESHEGETHSADEVTAGEQGERHSEFHAVYAMTCGDATKLTSVDFAFFDRFTGSQELDVTIVDDSGQSVYEVSRESRRLQRSRQ
jgi:Protein of unknown function (DUF2796)